MAAAMMVLFAARAEDVPVSVTGHPAYTRIVFSFPKLVGYHAVKTADGIALDFDTPLNAVAPASLPPAVSKFAISREGEMLKVHVALPAGEDFTHYRLMRKIVIDVRP